ncbi:MAG: prepilin-type N-terminal cleavage/methylation domain-containing protein [Deltaproteobacteria bacterium]|nr:prepilin-type N-terminal cleavage/methylation domain-containing protein [Deltaproteobacteria bacterium]
MKVIYIKLKHKGLNNTQGFTLIEVLLAILIFSLLIVTVYGSFNRVLTDVEAIDEDLIFHEAATNCFFRMDADLRSLHISMTPRYSPPEMSNPPDPFRVIGDKSDTVNNSFGRLRFSSSAHLPIDKIFHGGIAEIVYYVEADGEDHYVLKRTDRVDYESDWEPSVYDPVLCENIRSLKFTYYDQEGTEYDFWDSEDEEYEFSTPVAIGIELEIGRDKVSFNFKTSVTMPVFRTKMENETL